MSEVQQEQKQYDLLTIERGITAELESGYAFIESAFIVISNILKEQKFKEYATKQSKALISFTLQRLNSVRMEFVKTYPKDFRKLQHDTLEANHALQLAHFSSLMSLIKPEYRDGAEALITSYVQLIAVGIAPSTKLYTLAEAKDLELKSKLWEASQRGEQLEQYYYVSLKDTHKTDAYLTLWRSGSSGYTWAKALAGIYTEPSKDEGVLSVPVSVADALFKNAHWQGDVAPVLPNTPTVLKKMGTNTAALTRGSISNCPRKSELKNLIVK